MGTIGQSITLANSIIGVGILAMPFCFQQCGVLLAALILLSMGLVSRLCCYFLLKSSLIARRRNFEFLAFHVFGPAGKLAVELGIIGFLMGTCIAYFVVVGDLGPQIIAKMFNINQSDILRTSIMVIVSLVCVLPLGLLRNVDSLSNVSAATIAFYFCLVMKVIAEATSQLWSGDWRMRVEMWKPSGLLQCVPIFSMALFCQTQLFEIFESLPTLSLEKMNVVTKRAINICTCVYFTLGVFGYIAFSEKNISGNILMSLSPTMASDVIKLGFVMSLAFSFPLIIFPCRASLYSFLYKKAQKTHHDHIIHHTIPETTFRCITVAIIAVALFVSLLLPNIELVLGLLGSTIGVMICVVFPAACFVNVTFKDTNERVLAKGIVVLGLIIMVLGTYANLQAAETKLDRYDDKYFTQERIDKMVEDFFESKKIEKIEVNVKQTDAKDSVIQENTNKGSKEIIRDSEVQPPNPVPPETQPKENKKASEENNKLKELPEVKLDTASKSHPKILKTNFNEVKLNSNDEPDPKLTNGNKVNVNNIDKPKEEAPAVKEVKVPSNEEKNDIMKQQQLIETIKQHDKEQKELIKEQKEILNELIKTKKELQQNKKEVGSVEAKKIAVESIQKIANMAIQSLSGVSEKPREVVKDEPVKDLEKTANEAVQEIAKKAAETIEAINVKKDDASSDQGTNNKNLQQVNDQTNIQNDHIMKDSNPKQSHNVNINPAEIQNSNSLGIQNVNNVPSNNIPSNKAQRDVNQNAVKPHASNKPVININDVQSNHIETNLNANAMQPIANNDQQQPNAQLITNKDGLNPQNPNIAQQIPNVQAKSNPNIDSSQPILHQPIINENVASNVDGQHIETNSKTKETVNEKQSNGDNLKEHIHSADEPQSYKEGEDLQKKIDMIVPNVPIAVAMNGNARNNKDNEDIEVKVAARNQEQNAINSNGVQEIGSDVNTLKDNVIDDKMVHSRQKREAVDCTENKLSFKPEDEEICRSMNVVLKRDETHPLKSDLNKVSLPEIDQEILPKLELNEVILPKGLPLDGNIIHHISRSLKKYDETER